MAGRPKLPRCPDCNRTFKSASGLASHRRHVHAPPSDEGSDAQKPGMVASVASDIGDVEGANSLKALALVLAGMVGSDLIGHRDRIAAGKELRATLADLGIEAVPAPKADDDVDELAARRAARQAAAADRARPSGGSQ